MIEVFGKNPVTSSEFPVVLFDAGGTLMHLTPPLEKFFRDQMNLKGHAKSEEEINLAWIRMLHDLNRHVEHDPDWTPSETFWIESLLEHIAFPKVEIQETSREIHQTVTTALKWVISTTVIECCEELKRRGYRLGIVSNANHQLSEIFRMAGLLDLFEVIMTAGSDHDLMKPKPSLFLEAAEDLGVDPHRIIHVGESFAIDVVGAQRAGMKAVLYDPTFRELKALAETTTESFSKVVSIETLRQHRRLQGVKVVTKIDDLLNFFQG